ncbi:MAG: uncharacterized protein K0R15_2841 [Clostridiales bacterium]|nr:uncharacterized protein [Clostridiales bacterium]
MKIDIHVHTFELSPCGKAPAEEQIKAAIKRGVDAIFFTDHDKLYPQNELDIFNEKYAPFKVYQAIEVSLFENGENEHILVLGVHDKRLESKDWNYEELFKFVRENNGYLAIAHPFRARPTLLPSIDADKYRPDAIELFSVNAGKDKEQIRLNLARELGCHLLTNSDSHDIDTVGGYVNVLENNATTEEEIINQLKKGMYQICTYNPLISRF